MWRVGRGRGPRDRGRARSAARRTGDDAGRTPAPTRRGGGCGSRGCAAARAGARAATRAGSGARVRASRSPRGRAAARRLGRVRFVRHPTRGRLGRRRRGVAACTAGHRRAVLGAATPSSLRRRALGWRRRNAGGHRDPRLRDRQRRSAGVRDLPRGRGIGLARAHASGAPWAAVVLGQELSWISKRRVGAWVAADAMVHVVRPQWIVRDLGSGAQTGPVGVRLVAGPCVRL